MRKRLLSCLLCFTVLVVMLMSTIPAYGALSDSLGKVTIKTVDVKNNTFTVDWKKATGAKKYQLPYKAEDSDSWTRIKTTKTIMTVEGESYTKYKIKVRAISGKDHGRWSNIKTVTTRFERPNIALMSYDGKLCAEWLKINKAKKYEVAYKRATSKVWTKKLVASRYFSVSAKKGQDYKLKVRAINGDIKGPWSAIKKITMRSKYAGSFSKYVMYGWKGIYSERMLKQTIDIYKKHYEPLEINKKEDGSKIVLNIGKYDSAKIITVSKVGNCYEELKWILELRVAQSYNPDNGRLTFDGSWWFGDDLDDETYSYLIRLERKGVNTYKYFRINYSEG